MNTGRLNTALSLIERFENDRVTHHQPLAAASAFAFGMGGQLRKARRSIRLAERLTYDDRPPDGSANMTSSLALTRGSLGLDGVDEALADGLLAYELEPLGSLWRPVAALIVGLGHTMKGEAVAATPYFQEAAEAGEAVIRAYALAELSLGHLARGDPAYASETADEACRVVSENGLDDLFVAATSFAASALASLALGHRERATVELGNAARSIELVGSAMPMDAMHTDLILARAALGLGDGQAARRSLDRASRVAGTIRDTGTMAETLAELLELLDCEAPVHEVNNDVEPSFSERELQVIVLLSSDLTIREIGDELYLSRNTIKTHLRRIYHKLLVSSRESAVKQAREMGLFPE